LTLKTFWERYVCAEDPDDKRERIRRQRIAYIKADVVLREAFARWEKERA
jgi:hypothetical protein